MMAFAGVPLYINAFRMHLSDGIRTIKEHS